MLTEDGERIDYDEEVERIAELIFEDETVPRGATLHVFTPNHRTHAGWVMWLNREPQPSQQ